MTLRTRMSPGPEKAESTSLVQTQPSMIGLELREPQLSPLVFQGKNTQIPMAEEPLGVASLPKHDKNIYFPKLKFPFWQRTDWMRGYQFSTPSHHNLTIKWYFLCLPLSNLPKAPQCSFSTFENKGTVLPKVTGRGTPARRPGMQHGDLTTVPIFWNESAKSDLSKAVWSPFNKEGEWWKWHIWRSHGTQSSTEATPINPGLPLVAIERWCHMISPPTVCRELSKVWQTGLLHWEKRMF